MHIINSILGPDRPVDMTIFGEGRPGYIIVEPHSYPGARYWRRLARHYRVKLDTLLALDACEVDAGADVVSQLLARRLHRAGQVTVWVLRVRLPRSIVDGSRTYALHVRPHVPPEDCLVLPELKARYDAWINLLWRLVGAHKDATWVDLHTMNKRGVIGPLPTGPHEVGEHLARLQSASGPVRPIDIFTKMNGVDTTPRWLTEPVRTVLSTLHAVEYDVPYSPFWGVISGELMVRLPACISIDIPKWIIEGKSVDDLFDPARVRVSHEACRRVAALLADGLMAARRPSIQEPGVAPRETFRSCQGR